MPLWFGKGYVCLDILTEASDTPISVVSWVYARGQRTTSGGEDWSARECMSDRICGVTLYVKLKLRRFSATAAARSTASLMYFVKLE